MSYVGDVPLLERLIREARTWAARATSTASPPWPTPCPRRR
jgi:hypothetical protein